MGCNKYALLFILSLSMCVWGSYAQVDSVKKNSVSMDGKPWPVSRFSAHLGAFWAINTTQIGAGIDGRGYSVFSFENDLQMDRNTYSILFNFDTRLGKRNRINFSYYNIFRNTTVVLNKEIEFGEHTYPVDSESDIFLNTNIFRLSYGYSFVSNPQLELGALVGFHVMAFNMGFDLSGQTTDLSYNDRVKFTAPLPDIGFYGTYAFHDRWAASIELSSLYVKYKSFTGRLLNASLGAQYRLADHWEVDLGYTVFDVLIRLNRRDLSANFDWGYNGPFVNVAYKFGR